MAYQFLPRQSRAKVNEAINQAISKLDDSAIVYVPHHLASHFQKQRQDQHTYCIRNERRPWLVHVSGPRTQFTLDEKNPKLQVRQYANGKRIEPKYGSKPKPQQVDKTKSFLNADQDALAIRLISIKRVEQITGFGKSYIYENGGGSFPQRISFGSSKRSASRWIESEVIAWATQMAASRTTNN